MSSGTNDEIVSGFSKKYYAVKLYPQAPGETNHKFVADKAGRRLLWENGFALNETLSLMKKDWENDTKHYSRDYVNKEFNDRIIFDNTVPFAPPRETSITLEFQAYGSSYIGGFSASHDECYARIVVKEKE
jgi:hypothetical protein